MTYTQDEPVTFFSTDNRSKELGIISPSIALELNKAGSFEFTLPPFHTYYNSFHKLKSIVMVYDGDDLIFRGRVSSIQTDFYKQKQIQCESDLAFLCDTMQEPITNTQRISSAKGKTETNHDFPERTPRARFTKIIQNHNNQLPEGSPKRFNLGEISITKANDDRTFSSSQYKDTMSMIKEDFLDRYGGILRTRFALNNETNKLEPYIDYIQEISTVSGQPIEWASNLLEFSVDQSSDNFWTALIPIGDDNIDITNGSLSGSNADRFFIKGNALMIKSLVEQYGIIYKTESFSGAKNVPDLINQAITFIDETIKSMVDTYTVKAIDLHLLGNGLKVTKQDNGEIVSTSSKLLLGYKFPLRSSPHGVDVTLTCIKADISPYEPQNNSYDLGVPDRDIKHSKDISSQTSSAKGSAGSAGTMATTVKYELDRTGEEITDQAYKISLIASPEELEQIEGSRYKPGDGVYTLASYTHAVLEGTQATFGGHYVVQGPYSSNIGDLGLFIDNGEGTMRLRNVGQEYELANKENMKLWTIVGTELGLDTDQLLREMRLYSDYHVYNPSMYETVPDVQLKGTPAPSPVQKGWYEFIIKDVATGAGEYVLTQDVEVAPKKTYYVKKNADEYTPTSVYDDTLKSTALEMGQYKRISDPTGYTEIKNPSGSPSDQGWYEYFTSTRQYGKTQDTTIVANKKYYTQRNPAAEGWFERVGSGDAPYTPVANPTGNPQLNGWHEKDSETGKYYVTHDTTVKQGKTYYTYRAYVPTQDTTVHPNKAYYAASNHVSLYAAVDQAIGLELMKNEHGEPIKYDIYGNPLEDQSQAGFFRFNHTGDVYQRLQYAGIDIDGDANSIHIMATKYGTDDSMFAILSQAGIITTANNELASVNVMASHASVETLEDNTWNVFTNAGIVVEAGDGTSRVQQMATTQAVTSAVDNVKTRVGKLLNDAGVISTTTLDTAEAIVMASTEFIGQREGKLIKLLNSAQFVTGTTLDGAEASIVVKSGRVTADINATVQTNGESVIKISADKVELGGYVTANQFSALEADFKNVVVYGTSKFAYTKAEQLVGDELIVNSNCMHFVYGSGPTLASMYVKPLYLIGNTELTKILAQSYTPASVSLAHSHALTTAEEKVNGQSTGKITISLGDAVAVGSADATKTFNIADTDFYKAGVSAARSGIVYSWQPIQYDDNGSIISNGRVAITLSADSSITEAYPSCYLFVAQDWDSDGRKEVSIKGQDGSGSYTIETKYISKPSVTVNNFSVRAPDSINPTGSAVNAKTVSVPVSVNVNGTSYSGYGSATFKLERYASTNYILLKWGSNIIGKFVVDEGND